MLYTIHVYIYIYIRTCCTMCKSTCDIAYYTIYYNLLVQHTLTTAEPHKHDPVFAEGAPCPFKQTCINLNMYNS